MHDPSNFEARVGDALSRYADLAPVSVDADAMTRAASRSGTGTSVAVRWGRWFDRGNAGALLLLVLLAAGAVGAVVVGGRLLDEPPPFRPAIVVPPPSRTPSPSSEPSRAQDPKPIPSPSFPDPAPKATATVFDRRFEYVIPAESAIRLLERQPRRGMVAWVDGPDVSPGPAPENENPAGQPQPEHVRGVVVGGAGEAWSHGNGGRFKLRTAPAEFLADLRDTAHVPMGAIAETTLDGRPALMVMLPGTGGTDIHVSTPMTGLGDGNWVLVTVPSRLIVTEIEGETVFILIWARTADDLATWLPVADEFVASIHFVPHGEP